jgi:hypothetical protein
MRLSRAFGFLSVALAGSALALPCAAVPDTPTGDPAGAAVVRRLVPTPAAPPGTSNPPAGSAPSRSAPPVVVPAGSIYVCVSETAGVHRETAIAFTPEVGALCAKHPEMGPCQYERNACRRSGGRVYAAGGVEITLQMEAEYDRRVMRVLIK